MKIQIRHRHTNEVLHEIEGDNVTIRDCVVDAISNRASLRYADLRYVNLYGANLSRADLRSADLSSADLYGADFSGADFSGADLSRADLRRADLRRANLSSADLYGADLRSADLNGAENIPLIPFACPSDGSFIGWKKVLNYLIELEIPATAKRSSATTSKCRCDQAKVLSITDIESKASCESVTNYRYNQCTYTVGEMVYPDSFDEDRWKECSHGIHFFINREEAVNYE